MSSSGNCSVFTQYWRLLSSSGWSGSTRLCPLPILPRTKNFSFALVMCLASCASVFQAILDTEDISDPAVETAALGVGLGGTPVCPAGLGGGATGW